MPTNHKNDPIENDSSLQKCYRVRLTVSESTKDMVMNECREEFIRHHPELKGMKITENFIIRQIAEFYLKEP